MGLKPLFLLAFFAVGLSQLQSSMMYNYLALITQSQPLVYYAAKATFLIIILQMALANCKSFIKYLKALASFFYKFYK